MNPNFKFISQLTALTLLTTCASAQQVNWAPLQMRNRWGPRLVYDSDRQVVVMFGGSMVGTSNNLNFANSDTWEWDGASWSRKSTSGPSPRWGHVMVYDSIRHKTVVIGRTGSDSFNKSDVWEWDGSAWTRVNVSGPGDQLFESPCGTFDSVRGVIVIVTQGWSDDEKGTWTWNGQAWSHMDSFYPSGRCSMAFDSVRRRAVLYSGPLMETWEWDGVHWDRRYAGVTGDFEAMAFDNDRGVVVLHGTADSSYSRAETWEWNGTTWTQRAEIANPPRFGHGIAYDSARHQMVLFGGSPIEQRNAETFVRTGDTWNVVGQMHPTGRQSSAIAYDNVRHKTILFGGEYAGFSPQAPYDAETWEWDGAQWTQLLVQGPEPRALHQMVYDPLRHRTVLAGGRNLSGSLAGTWEWDGVRWERFDGLAPSGNGIAMAFDSGRGVMIAQVGSPTPQTWIRTATTWATMQVQTPPQDAASMAYDERRDVTVLFGGTIGNVNLGETWEWNGSTWQRVATTGPSARRRPAMAYDRARQVVVLTSGEQYSSGSPDTSVWEWDGAAWMQRRTFGPQTAFRNPAMTYDSDHHLCLLFGGDAPETWGLGDFECIGPIAAAGADRTPALHERLVLQAGAASLDTSLQYQWRRNQIPLDPARYPTATTGRLEIYNLQPTDRGDYDCVVTDYCASDISDPIHIDLFCSADFNRDTVIDLFDYLDFVDAFSHNSSSADFNHDGIIDFFDYLNFVDTFSQPC